MALRLYYDDPYATECESRILRVVADPKGQTGVVLERTCFYPTSGGQPCDHGTLGAEPILDATEDEGEVVHWVARAPERPSVRVLVDWRRRFDHMQQHTGQHILSQAFSQVLGASTVSFHLGEETCTIDLDRANLAFEEVQSVEDLANSVIFSDRPTIARFVEPDELSSLPLRKIPEVTKDVRVVTVEGFDCSPCGGTHCTRAGEVGVIAIRRWERRGRETRVEFVCGWRALRDYRWKTSAINQLAATFSVKDADVTGAVSRLSEDAAETRKELHRLQDEALNLEASSLLKSAVDLDGARVVRRAFVGRDAQQVRKLASLLTAEPGTIAILGTVDTGVRLVFARSDDVTADMAATLKTVCKALGGSGGGQAKLAQGGGLPAEKIEEALELALRSLAAKG